MSLIDVDELKKRATKVMFRDAPECGEFDAVAVDDIDCIPTIDPESLQPTAHWIRKKVSCIAEATFCSNCGRGTGSAYKYFPHCGARMVNADD